MFSKSFVIFAASALPVALGMTWNTPTNVTSGLVSNITWVSTAGDSVFTVELNHPSFSNSIAIRNNIDPSLDVLSIEWPIVPADSDYTLSAVNIGNISDVFAQSAAFNIAQAPTTASASISTTFAVTSSGASGSTTGASSGATTGTGTATSDSGSSGTSSSSTSATSPASFNGAASFKTASGVVAILATVAGATLFL